MQASKSQMSETVINLTDAQINEFREAFVLFDKDRDGKLSSKELGTALRACGVTPTEGEIRKMTQEVDAHYGGFVDLPRFMFLLVQGIKVENKEASIREALNLFDKDESGYISTSDFRYVMKNLGEKLTDEEVNELIEEADADCDGRIHYESFVNMLTWN